MNTRTPPQGRSALHIPDSHAADTTAEGQSALPNNMVSRSTAQRLTATDVMMLQRSAGNRAVQRLLQREPQSQSSPQAPTISRAPNKPLIQAKIDINSIEHVEETDPATKWGLTTEQVNLYKELVTSGETMLFKDEAGMLDYIKHYAKWFDKHPTDYRNQATGPNTAPIESASAGAAKSEGGEIRSVIDVNLAKGVKETVNVFSSEKRHLLDTFTQNRGKPPDSKINNSIVTDSSAFATQFKDYADTQAKALLEHRMLQGFRPATTIHTSSTVAFKSDQNEIPNESYDRHNAIHSFPASGSEVYSPDQATYAMIANVASYLYQTDDYGRSRQPDLKGKRRFRQVQLEGWKRKKDETAEIVDSKSPGGKKTIYPNRLNRGKAKENRENLKNNLTTFTKYGFTPKRDPAEIENDFKAIKKEEKGAIFGNINGFVEGLANLAFTYGAIQEVDTGADLSVPLGEAAANYQELQTNLVGKPIIDAMIKQFPPKIDPKTLETATPSRTLTRSMKYKNAKDAQYNLYKLPRNASMLDKIKKIQELYALLEASKIDLKVDM